MLIYFSFFKKGEKWSEKKMTEKNIFMFEQLFSWYKGPRPTLENDIKFYLPFLYDKTKLTNLQKRSSLSVYFDKGKIVYTADFFMEAYYVHKFLHIMVTSIC